MAILAILCVFCLPRRKGLIKQKRHLSLGRGQRNLYVMSEAKNIIEEGAKLAEEVSELTELSNTAVEKLQGAEGALEDASIEMALWNPPGWPGPARGSELRSRALLAT